MGWLLSLVSGNFFVVLFLGAIGLLVGVILGLVYRNDPVTSGKTPRRCHCDSAGFIELFLIRVNQCYQRNQR